MIDHSYLDSLSQLLGKKEVNAIRLVYVNESTQKMQELLDAWNEKSYEELQNISHSLKSSSLNMAMTTFAGQCQLIENLAPDQDEQSIKFTIDELPRIHQQSLTELAAYFAK